MSYAAANPAMQGLPATTRSWRGKEIFFPRAFRESMALLMPRSQTTILQGCERINFCYSKPPVLWEFVTSALGN